MNSSLHSGQFYIHKVFRIIIMYRLEIFFHFHSRLHRFDVGRKKSTPHVRTPSTYIGPMDESGNRFESHADEQRVEMYAVICVSVTYRNEEELDV